MIEFSKEPMVIKFDLTGIRDNDQLLNLFNEKFGFVEWFGYNFNALVDCLFTFYFPDESLCNISNENGSETILEFKIESGNEKNLIYIINVLSYVNLKLFEIDFPGRFSFRPIGS